MAPRILDGIRSALALTWFRVRGAAPHVRGYHAHKERELRRALEEESLLQRFRRGEPLPPRHGVGIDERIVEYPWAISALGEGSGRLLDAGSVLNHRFLVEHPAVASREVHILTFAPEPECFWHRGISYLFGDLRQIPIRDAFYDTAVCLSTLEHVGCDNSGYSGTSAHREDRPTDYRKVMAEIARVLQPGGTLLLSVPFGRHAHHGWLQVFDAAMLDDAIAAFGPVRERSDTFFRYRRDGWHTATPTECADATYAGTMGQLGDRGAADVEQDGAAAARAVACIRLVKG